MMKKTVMTEELGIIKKKKNKQNMEWVGKMSFFFQV